MKRIVLLLLVLLIACELQAQDSSSVRIEPDFDKFAIKVAPITIMQGEIPLLIEYRPFKEIGIQLSGGERRRTEIARCLAVDPKFILLDEPFAGIDPIAVEDIQNIVRKLKNKNIGVLITDHNVHETLTITDRSYLLFEGSILMAGTSQELAQDPHVRKVYLGQNFELR